MGNSRGIIYSAVLDTADGIFYSDGGEIKTGWQTINGKSYFFNTEFNGELVAAGFVYGALVKCTDGCGTITALNYTESGKIRVNVEADGARLLGVVIDGADAYYYLDGIAGKLIGRIEDNYYNVGNIYFANAEGKLYSGDWTDVNGVYYSFNADYSMKTWHINDTTEIAGATIYTDGEGRKITTGWYLTHGVGGKYIENGVMIVASTEFTYKIVDGVYYVFAADGTATYYTGWHADNAHYVASGIVVKDRFEEIDGNNYYFDAEGLIVKAAVGENIKVVIGTWVYSIDGSGVAVQYVVDNNNPSTWVYFLTDGMLDTNAKGYYTSTGLITSQAIVIDTATYVFDANGKLVMSKDNYECNGVIYIIDAEGKATAKDEDDE
jgi:glucan-binding YG repeat protein